MEGPQRPSDDEIIKQISALEAEQLSNPLIGPLESVSRLAREYEGGSEVFVQKTKEICRRYTHMRKVCSDGNCFYRAFSFALLEHAHATRQSDPSVLAALKETATNSTALLTSIGLSTFVFEDFYDLFIAQVNRLAECTLSDLEDAFRDDEISNGITLYMRFLTSAELKINADEYMPFIDEGLSMDQFCNLHVDRFGEEADQLQITALMRVFHRQLHILYLDQSAIDQPNIIDIGSEGAVDLPTHFLYKPGHYDLLYA
eukprot:comp17769_c0_seq1/m.17804 comp17769_c0_seq1/g.17804  ORF comp17769_c0_seq1/g.17804 comp17769_c0_seq1/m.17804 type:complete len:258 (-) comp17769_c0_seq1:248-1021(-)